MNGSRLYWASSALGLLFVAMAVLLARFELLFGAAGIGAWLLAQEYAFVRTLRNGTEDLEVTQELSRERIPTDGTVRVSLSGELPRSSPMDLRIVAPRPVTAEGPDAAERTAVLPSGWREATASFEFTFRVAGSVAFDSPTVVASDPLGFFSETVSHGTDPSLTVEPRGAGNVHVGEGGRRLSETFGEHSSGRKGPGITFAELRPYASGDTLRRIDWKATARFSYPHVREFEIEGSWQLALLVDCRASMGDGPDGETKLDYARQVALALADGASDASDPVGLYTVDDRSFTVRKPLTSRSGDYDDIREEITDLRAARGVGSVRDSATDIGLAGPGTVHRVRGYLDEESRFDDRLRPFFTDREPYAVRTGDDPLFEAVRIHLKAFRKPTCIAIFTDDRNRGRLRATVKLARRAGDRVLVFLAPDVLFDSRGLVELDETYDRYSAFEEFRRDLARIPHVSAFEVGPGDRLERILSSGETEVPRNRDGA